MSPSNIIYHIKTNIPFTLKLVTQILVSPSHCYLSSKQIIVSSSQDQLLSSNQVLVSPSQCSSKLILFSPRPASSPASSPPNQYQCLPQNPSLHQNILLFPLTACLHSNKYQCLPQIGISHKKKYCWFHHIHHIIQTIQKPTFQSWPLQNKYTVSVWTHGLFITSFMTQSNQQVDTK